MIKTIGIDLGTTNTVAAHMKKGEPREIRNFQNQYLTPSALALGPNGELLTGEDARTRGDGIVMSYKPDMGTDKTYEFNGLRYTPRELSAIILRHIKKYAEKALGEPVLRAVITVPAWFNDRAIVETREAGMMAGFYVVKTFSEPMSAALAWGIDREESDPKTILVYDLGGGTFDIAVLMVTPGNFAVLDHEGDVHLGGDNFDEMVAQEIRRRLRDRGAPFPEDSNSLRKLKLSCEQAKVILSMSDTAPVNLPALGAGGINVNETITRSEFEAMIRPWLLGPRKERDENNKPKKSTMDHVKAAVVASDLSADTIDNILLVGGSSCIPLVEQILKAEYTEAKIMSSDNPMFSVAHGAAIESQLIHEIDCVKCHTKNPVTATSCEKCGAPLIGEEKIDCPKCFLPSPAGEQKCWKCGTDLHASASAPAIDRPAPVKKCPNGHENPIDANTCPECGHVFEEEGIKCPSCGKIIKQTDIKCPHCGAEKPIRTEITPKPIGIKLDDGSFSIIVPKGTNYPTEKPLHAQYSTPMANAQFLKIIVMEGENEVADKNDWLGDLMLELPKGQPENTPIDISMDLDSDGTIFVSAKLVDKPLSVVNATISRVEGGAEFLKDARELGGKIKSMKNEAGKEEKKKLDELNEEIEGAINKGDTRAIGNRLDEWKKRLEEVESKAGENERIENIIAVAEFTLKVASEYMDGALKNKIEKLIRETQQAYNAGDMTKASEKSKELTDALNELGNAQIIVSAEMAARHRKVSTATSSQIFRVLDELKSAVSNGRDREISQILDRLIELLNQAVQEITQAGEKVDFVLPKKSQKDFGTMS